MISRVLNMAGVQRKLITVCALSKSSFTRCISSSRELRGNNKSSGQEIRNVTVIGAGLMGSGIAQVAAQNNFNVVLVDAEDEYIQKSMVIIRKSLDRITKKRFRDEPERALKFINDTISKITTKFDAVAGVANADLVIEALPEDMELKQNLLRKIDGSAPPSCIFASGTSSLPISELAKVTHRNDKFGGLHFFHPVPIMNLVEVIKAKDTSQGTFDSLFEFSKNLGKTPVSSPDTRGFIVNKLLFPYMMEAIRLVETENVIPSDVDKAMKLGAGYPMGPFQLVDYVGLDTLKSVIDAWHINEPDKENFKPSEILNKMVGEGKLGTKTGEGFYKYNRYKK